MPAASPPISSQRRMELYESLGKNIVEYEKHLRYTFNLPFESENIRFLRDVLFMGADLCVSIRAELLCEEPYARRFYLKRLWLNLVEAYRALYNGDSDEYSYLSLFIKAYPQLREHPDFAINHKNLRELGKSITAVTMQRNSFAHYDKDVWQTIRTLDWIDNEETPTQLCCQLLTVLESLMKLGNSVLCVGGQTNRMPQSSGMVSSVVELIREQMAEKDNLLDLLDSIPVSTMRRINFNKRACRFMKFFQQTDVIALIDASTLIQIVRADLSCSLKACLMADTQLEAMANLRMSVVSAFDGYRNLRKIYLKASEYLSSLCCDNRNFNVHYRYKDKDYIPGMYYSYYDFSPIDKLLQMVDVLNELNAIQNKITAELRSRGNC